MKRIAVFSAWLAVASVPFLPGTAGAKDPAPPPRPAVQIAILLDTSNSMDGLIGQAKTQLWNIVNEFVRARKGGRPPAIEVALFAYGKSTLPASHGYEPPILPPPHDPPPLPQHL